MRIIAGLAKGRKLLSPVGYDTTRPTLDRVKESIFSIIQNKLQDSVVVDVFAGTGSLGLEAVSRGAKKCYLIDESRETFSFLKQNVINLKFDEKCSCINTDSYRALEEFGSKNIKFDIIFIDPPYKKNMIPKALDIIKEKKLLDDHGIIVSKIDSREEIHEGNGDIILSDHRKYGKTIICIYKKYKEDK